jgi:hypothetical protein
MELEHGSRVQPLLELVSRKRSVETLQAGKYLSVCNSFVKCGNSDSVTVVYSYDL